MPTSIDLAFAAFFAVALTLFEHVAFWPRVRPAMEADAPGARLRAYRTLVAAEWLLALGVAARWLVTRRPWSDLGLVAPGGWRLAVSFALVALFIWLIATQDRKLAAASARQRASLRSRLGPFAFMIPHTLAEHRWFQALSVTAGICEELLFRGFLVWALRPWLGLWGAAAATAILFGLGHLYLGRTGFIRATFGGVLFGGVALLTGSIVPGMIIHALADLQTGMIGWAAFRDGIASPDAQRLPGTAA